MRTTEDELVIHDRAFAVVVRHRLFPKTVTGRRSECKDREPPRDSQGRLEELAQRFAELGTIGSRFLEGLLAGSRYGKNQAERVLRWVLTTHVTTWSQHWSGLCVMGPSPWRPCDEFWKHPVDPAHRWMRWPTTTGPTLTGCSRKTLRRPAPPRTTKTSCTRNPTMAARLSPRGKICPRDLKGVTATTARRSLLDDVNAALISSARPGDPDHARCGPVGGGTGIAQSLGIPASPARGAR